uniref:Uncharacterized protein n=1 Tax=Haplochromis burtoni TaxID=8153 RepID=A0A3Q2VHA5_HAPBU
TELWEMNSCQERVSSCSTLDNLTAKQCEEDLLASSAIEHKSHPPTN